MPSRQTNKTEFLRYLDDHESEVPMLRKLAGAYREHNKTRHTFGMWIHARHIGAFQRAYSRWWLKNPQLWGIIYEELSAR